MYERFTDRARKVMALANKKAVDSYNECVECVHLLWAIAEEGGGVAADILAKCTTIDDIDKLIIPGPKMVVGGKLPLTPIMKNTIAEAIKQAKSLNHNYVGTEHLLLALTYSSSFLTKCLGMETVGKMILEKNPQYEPPHTALDIVWVITSLSKESPYELAS